MNRLLPIQQKTDNWLNLKSLATPDRGADERFDMLLNDARSDLTDVKADDAIGRWRGSRRESLRDDMNDRRAESLANNDDHTRQERLQQRQSNDIVEPEVTTDTHNGPVEQDQPVENDQPDIAGDEDSPTDDENNQPPAEEDATADDDQTAVMAQLANVLASQAAQAETAGLGASAEAATTPMPKMPAQANPGQAEALKVSVQSDQQNTATTEQPAEKGESGQNAQEKTTKQPVAKLNVQPATENLKSDGEKTITPDNANVKETAKPQSVVKEVSVSTEKTPETTDSDKPVVNLKPSKDFSDQNGSVEKTATIRQTPQEAVSLKGQQTTDRPVGPDDQAARPRLSDRSEEYTNSQSQKAVGAKPPAIVEVAANNTGLTSENQTRSDKRGPITPDGQPLNAVKGTTDQKADVLNQIIRTDRSAPSGADSSAEARENVDRVVRAARAAVARGASRIQIRLEPPELGALRIDIRHNANGLQLQLQATSSRAQQLLQQNSSELRASLDSQGLGNVQIDVQLRPELRGDNTGQQNQGQGQQNFGQRGDQTGDFDQFYDSENPAQSGGDGSQGEFAERGFSPEKQPEEESDGWQDMKFTSLDVMA